MTTNFPFLLHHNVFHKLILITIIINHQQGTLLILFSFANNIIPPVITESSRKSFSNNEGKMKRLFIIQIDENPKHNLTNYLRQNVCVLETNR
jgi:hypothetical protein